MKGAEQKTLINYSTLKKKSHNRISMKIFDD